MVSPVTSLLTLAESAPAGGAALDQVAIATAIGLGLGGFVVWLGAGHRSGRVRYLGRAAAWAGRVMKLPLSPRSVLAAAAALLLLVTPVAAQTPDHKLDQALRALRRGGAQRVIIQTTAGARDAVRRALRSHGGKVAAEHPGIDAITAEVHVGDLRRLAERGDVTSIALDAEVTATGSPKRHSGKHHDHDATVSPVSSATSCSASARPWRRATCAVAG